MDAARRFRTLVFLLVLLFVWLASLVLFGASVDCKINTSEWTKASGCDLTKFLFDWQQLIGAGIALLAAWVGWRAIDRQIRQSEIQEQERIRAKRAAARAALPLALATIGEYAEECAQRLALMLPEDDQEALPDDALWQGPALPMEALLDIRTLVETLPEKESHAFATILSNIQVQASRLRSIRPSRLPHNVGVVIRYNIEQYILDSAEIFALGARMFGYARGHVDEVPLGPLSRADMRSALLQMGSLDAIRGIEERLNRYYE